MNKKLIAFTLILTILLAVAPIGAMASTNAFDATYVLDDLEGATIGGKTFNIDNYGYQTGDPDCEIITLSEYGYSPYANARDNYALYLYVYNPSGKSISDSGHSITLATAYDSDMCATAYAKFDMQLVSKSYGEYDNLIYKFKVIDQKGSDGLYMAERVNVAKRVYDASGFELRHNNNTIEDYKIGGRYTYTGYGVGLGDKDSPALTSSVKDMVTLALDLTPTTWKSSSSSLGADHKNQLSTVYFGVDNDILSDYGTVNKIMAEWWEYKTTNFIIADDELYEDIAPYIGIDVGIYDGDVPVGIATGSNTNYMGGTWKTYDWSWNIEQYGRPTSSSLSTATQPILGGVINDNDLGNVSSETMANYIYDYRRVDNQEYVYFNGRAISTDLLTTNVDNGRTAGHNLYEFSTKDVIDITAYDDTHNGWQKFWDYWGKWQIDTATADNADPFYEVKASDLLGLDSTIADRLYIAEEDVDQLKLDFASNELSGKTTMLFRFANTDYYSTELDTVNGSGGNGYMFNETVFMDFDIIYMTFIKDGVETVIPVVSDPTDVIGGPVAPDEPCDIWKIIQLILMFIVFILIISLIGPWLPYIILAPFKFISWLSKKSNKRKR